MIVGLFVLLAALPGGWLADRFGKKLLVAISGFLAASGALLVVDFSSDEHDLSRGNADRYGWQGFSTRRIGRWVRRWYPRNKLDVTLVCRTSLEQVQGAIGAYIGGPIADHSSYGLLFSIYGGLYLISTLPLLGIESRGCV